MEVRPIDANAMLNELRPVSFESEHSAMLLSDVSKMMREWVERQPTLTQPNEPLTIEQLQDMDGEPVYLVAQRYGISEWNILNGIDEIVLAYDEPVVGMKAVIPGIKFINGRVLGVGSYGEDWLAYRRPPEGEA